LVSDEPSVSVSPMSYNSTLRHISAVVEYSNHSVVVIFALADDYSKLTATYNIEIEACNVAYDTAGDLIITGEVMHIRTFIKHSYEAKSTNFIDTINEKVRMPKIPRSQSRTSLIRKQAKVEEEEEAPSKLQPSYLPIYVRKALQNEIQKEKPGSC